MPRYAALLGSINVGGYRLKMTDLVSALEREDFSNVATVDASGNVLFEHPRAGDAKLGDEIAGLLKERFAIDSFVAVRTRDEIALSIIDNPFHGDGQDKFVHTIFLSAQPAQERFEALLAEHQAKGGERLALDYVHGVGVSSLTGAFLQRRLGVRGTARNMTSLKRILEKMG